jgi:hypothetical protein
MQLILDTKGSGGPTTPEAQPLWVTAQFLVALPVVGQLYNLEEVPYETNDVYESCPRKVQQLLSMLRKRIWRGRSC